MWLDIKELAVRLAQVRAEEAMARALAAQAERAEGDTLTLQFRNIALDWGQGEHYSAVVVLGGVREIRRFGKPVAQLLSEGEGADVLQFRRGEGTALLLVEWIYYRQPANIFAKYEIDYTTFSITAEKQDELIV